MFRKWQLFSRHYLEATGGGNKDSFDGFKYNQIQFEGNREQVADKMTRLINDLVEFYGSENEDVNTITEEISKTLNLKPNWAQKIIGVTGLDGKEVQNAKDRMLEYSKATITISLFSVFNFLYRSFTRSGIMIPLSSVSKSDHSSISRTHNLFWESVTVSVSPLYLLIHDAIPIPCAFTTMFDSSTDTHSNTALNFLIFISAPPLM